MKNKRVYLWPALILFVLFLLGRAAGTDSYAAPEEYALTQQELPPYAFPALLRAFGESAQALFGTEAVWAFRFPALFLALGLLLLLSESGRMLFGESRKNLLLAVLMSSLAFQWIAPWMSGDLWLMTALAGYGMTAVLHLKRPATGYVWSNLFFGLLGIWVAWLPAVAGMASFWAVLRFGHPFGKRLNGLYVWALWLPAVLAGASGKLPYSPEFFFAAWPWAGASWPDLPALMTAYTGAERMTPAWYFLWQLLALLPWLGFLAAGLYEWSLRLRKREEMSLVAGAFLVAGLLSFSFLTQWAFALLIARQLEGYAQKNYPYEKTVKGFAILQLVFSFALIFAAVLLGVLATEGGFGTWAVKGLLWWVPAVVGVLGLFMRKPLMYIGGPLLASFAIGGF